jgi:hypothetical protein
MSSGAQQIVFAPHAIGYSARLATRRTAIERRSIIGQLHPMDRLRHHPLHYTADHKPAKTSCGRHLHLPWRARKKGLSAKL